MRGRLRESHTRRQKLAAQLRHLGVCGIKLTTKTRGFRRFPGVGRLALGLFSGQPFLASAGLRLLLLQALFLDLGSRLLLLAKTPSFHLAQFAQRYQ